MKCKKCGTSIPIDGTSISITGSTQTASTPKDPSKGKSSGSNAPRKEVSAQSPSAKDPTGTEAPVKSRPKNEPVPASEAGVSPLSTRWRVAEPSGRTQELSLSQVKNHHKNGTLEAGTLVCQPGKDVWMPPYDFPEIVGMTNVGKVDSPREEQPTFSDETVMLGAAEASALSRQAQGSAPDLFDQMKKEASAPEKKGSFFDDGNLSDAMDSFDSMTSLSPSAPNEEAPKASGATTKRPTSIPPPHPSPPSKPPTGAPPENKDSSGLPFSVPPAGALPLEMPALEDEDETRMVDSAIISPLAANQAASKDTPISSEDHSSKTSPESSQAGVDGSVDAPAATQAPPLNADSNPEESSGEPNSERESALSSLPHAPHKGSGLTAIFLAFIVLLGVLRGAYIFRPDIFQQGVERIFGEETTSPTLSPAIGPPFDEAAAGVVLGQTASLAKNCKDPQGPLGKGRAEVLYEPTGKATSVLVSKPFHDTTVGRCVVDLFLTTSVPAFGGDPVIVTKIFDVQ